jgi:hypothetical protein
MENIIYYYRATTELYKLIFKTREEYNKWLVSRSIKLNGKN